VRFCGGVFCFSLLRGKRESTKPPQQLTCVASSRHFLPCPLLKEGEKERIDWWENKQETKNKNGTFSVQEALFYTKLAFPTLTPRVHARLDKPNIECWSVCAGGFREESSLMTGVFCSTFWFSNKYLVGVYVFVRFFFFTPPATRGWALRAHFFYFRNLASYKCFRLVGERRVWGNCSRFLLRSPQKQIIDPSNQINSWCSWTSNFLLREKTG